MRGNALITVETFTGLSRLFNWVTGWISTWICPKPVCYSTLNNSRKTENVLWEYGVTACATQTILLQQQSIPIFFGLYEFFLVSLFLVWNSRFRKIIILCVHVPFLLVFYIIWIFGQSCYDKLPHQKKKKMTIFIPAVLK